MLAFTSLKAVSVTALTALVLSGCAMSTPPVDTGDIGEILTSPEPIIPISCSSGPLAEGEESTGAPEPLPLGQTVVGGECFDLIRPGDFEEFRADQRYIVEEFCAKLGVEKELNALLGHGNLYTSSLSSTWFNGEVGALINGVCTYEMQWDEAQALADEGVVTANSVTIFWTNMTYSTGPNPFDDFDSRRSSDEWTRTDLPGIGERAVRAQISDSVITYAAQTPLVDVRQTYVEIIIDFSPSLNDVAQEVDKLAPELLTTALNRSDELLAAYRDGSAYKLYTAYPEFPY